VFSFVGSLVSFALFVAFLLVLVREVEKLRAAARVPAVSETRLN
jgi:hypothetical protein